MTVLDRRRIFNAVRPMLDSKGFTPARIKEIDTVLDGMGFPPIEDVAFPSVATPRAKTALASPGAFYASIRASLFDGSLSVPQKDGIEATLKAMGERGFPIAFAAYVLATEYHETGAKMFPNVESLNYSVKGLLSTFGRHRISAADAQRLGRKPGEGPLSIERQAAIGNIVYGGEWGVQNLDNTEPGDGWKYRGRGKDHCTGRGNYAKVDKALGLNGALLANPDLLLDLNNAAAAIVHGMQDGRYTTKKLSDYLPRTGPATEAQFVKGRPIINGTDKAALIAGYAIKWQHAFTQGGWA